MFLNSYWELKIKREITTYEWWWWWSLNNNCFCQKRKYDLVFFWSFFLFVGIGSSSSSSENQIFVCLQVDIVHIIYWNIQSFSSVHIELKSRHIYRGGPLFHIYAQYSSQNVLYYIYQQLASALSSNVLCYIYQQLPSASTSASAWWRLIMLSQNVK